MTSPIAPVIIACPMCATRFTHYTRASVNMTLGETFSEEDLRSWSTAVCPTCEHTVDLDMLVVDSDGTFRFDV
jgi:hypothetical protein